MTQFTSELTIRELTVTPPFIKCEVREIDKFYSTLYSCITYKLSDKGYKLY